MRRCFLIAFLMIFRAFDVFPQGIIAFESMVHEFGNIKEGTEVEKVFYFTNKGNAPIVIQEVKASCGCTTPAWTKEPVLPNHTGMVKAVYHSAGRPGSFYKTITVVSNSTEPIVQLVIKGNVIPTAGSTVATIQQNLAENRPPKNNASLELLKSEHNFGKVFKGESVIYRFPLKNTGTDDLIISGVSSPCNCVQFKVPQPKIKPNEESYLELVYRPLQVGQESHSVEIISSASRQNINKITLHAVVIEPTTTNSPVKETTKVVW